MTLNEVNIYRITHISNVPHILAHGITHMGSPNANPDFVRIGDLSHIEFRSTFRARVDNGDYTVVDAGHIILGEFIPFCFGVRMPMLYVMQKGGNQVPRATPPYDIVYMRCSLTEVVAQCSEFYFSDGHGTSRITTFYDRTRINDLPSIIDWKAVKVRDWGGEENRDLRRKMEAEFLVKGDIPFHLIERFGCYNLAAKAKLVAMGVKEAQVYVIPSAYYEH